jgi:hypothetical protein
MDMEDMINLLYEYVYNGNTKNCYSYDNIVLGRIGLEDIKIPLAIIGKDSEEDIEQYEKLKNDIMMARFKLISYNDDENMFNHIIIKRYSDQFPVTIKVSFYPKSKRHINSLDQTVNNDSLFSYLLSTLVLNGKTKHILLPIMNIDINVKELDNIIKDERYMNKVKDMISNNMIHDVCCMQIREHFFRIYNLEEYLRSNICLYKPLLFQVIHTLATIQSEYPGFRHNNLKLKNIVIYQRKDKNGITEYMGINSDESYYLSDYNFDIKITNFELSVIPKYYGMINQQNSAQNGNNIMYANMDNPYYDLYTFLDDLLKITLLQKDSNCDDMTKKFLDKIFPPQIREGKMSNNMIIANPIELLNDIYFSEYKNKPSKKIIPDTFINHQYLTGKIETYMDSDNYSVLGNQDKIISKSNIMNKQYRSIKVDDEESNKLNRTIIENSETKSSETKSSETKNKRIIKQDMTSQIGGYEKPTISPYKAERNNPFLSNEQRDLNKKHIDEAPPKKEPPLILEQKVYDTSKPAPAKSQFPPSFIPLYDQDSNLMNHMYPYSNRVINQPPVQKVYNVSLTNPLGNYTSLNRIYEDVLPGSPYNFTAKTVFERKQLIDFFRNSLLDNGDGEEMTVTGGKNSLLSYIKVMDINPYIVNENPYENLPRDFLLYRAAYPVRLDDRTKSISIAKNAMGINVRIYKMSLGCLRCKTIGKQINADNFNLWREMKYYDWVREEVIKRKVSPNFICPILYKIDSESKVDWVKIDTIKYKGYTAEELRKLKENDNKVNSLHDIQKQSGVFASMLPKYYRKQIERNVRQILGVKEEDEKTKEEKAKEQKKREEEDKREDITTDSGKVLILLTEAPTTSIIQWSTTIYESYGSQKKMISTGYHTPEVWKSILFQLVYTFAVLQEKGIYMEQLSLANNIYIKDIFSDPNSIGSWIYKVDSVEYYVPNYGYILVFDTKYADIETNQSFVKKKDDNDDKQQFKINSTTLYEKNNIKDKDTIQVYLHNKFKEMISPDNFNSNMKARGGSVPDEKILSLLKAMYEFSDSSGNIRRYIHEFFRDMVHNRVGTLLTQTEKANINMLSRPNFSNGNMMVYQKRFQEYEWVIFLGDDTTNSRKKRIIRCDNDCYKEESVFTNFLYGYPPEEKILPESKKNMKYDESHIYETYNLDVLVPK